MTGLLVYHVLLLALILVFSQSNAFIIASPSHTSCSSIIRSNRNKPIAMAEPNDDNNNTESSSTGNVGTWNPLRLAVLKLKFTEIKYTSPLNYEKRQGTYKCANCNKPLFDSRGKYDSGSGWPSFWKTIRANSVGYQREFDGRIEIQCKNCKGHLGHVFPDGPRRMDVSKEEMLFIPEDDLKTSSEDNEYTRLPRYCVNGASLRFEQT